MKKLTALLLAALLCVGLYACGGEEPPPVVESTSPEPTPTISTPTPKEFALAYDPNADLHPITGTGEVNRMLTALVYEGLYALDEVFAPYPVLAANAAVDETGLVWTITPAEGVLFSDGTPLDASHIASSLNTARKSTLYSGRLANIRSVRASNGAVVITLNEPNGNLPALLDIPIVLEQEDSPTPLGTGRYAYVWAEDGPYLEVRREGLPFDTIRLTAVTDTSTRVAAFDSNRVTAVTTDYLSPYALGYSNTCESWEYPTTDLIYVGFRTANGPCQSPLVRRAFSTAFDRADIVTRILAGHGDTTTLPVFPGHSDWSSNPAALLEYNMDSAAALLAEAGYKKSDQDGLLYLRREPLAVTLLVNNDNETKTAIAEAIADELGKLGVTVTVNRLPWPEYTKALTRGTFDLYLAEVRMTADFDPTELLSGTLNYGKYDPTPLAEPLAAWRAATGTVRRWSAINFWRLFAEEVPFAPLCFSRETMLVQWNSVSDLTPVRDDPFRGMENWTIN